jgi:hypothetical protein
LTYYKITVALLQSIPLPSRWYLCGSLRWYAAFCRLFYVVRKFVYMKTLLLCSCYAGIIVHHSYQNTPSQFSQHIYARTSRKAGYFIRRLSVTILTSMVLFIIISFSMIAGDTNAKMSWPLIHADFSIVHVVTSNNENPSIRSIWWGLRFISLVYILLAVTSGEVRDVTKGIPVWRSERSSNDV